MELVSHQSCATGKGLIVSIKPITECQKELEDRTYGIQHQWKRGNRDDCLLEKAGCRYIPWTEQCTSKHLRRTSLWLHSDVQPGNTIVLTYTSSPYFVYDILSASTRDYHQQPL
jgi:hypothetical protein